MSAAAPTLANTAVVVDTDVVSYLFKEDTRAALYRPHLSGHYPVVSFMTVAELALWARVSHWGAATKERMEQFLAGFAIHYPDRTSCELWGSVMDTAQRAGKRIEVDDAWIATTALMYGVPLVTHNASHYAGVPDLVIRSESA